MAFAITRYCAYGDTVNDPVRIRARQIAELQITGLATDVTYDLGNPSGTFWTSALANVPGPTTLSSLQIITGLANNLLVRVSGDFATAYLRGAATGTGVYTQTTSNGLPNITFAAGNAPTSMTMILEWVLPDSVVAHKADKSNQ